MAVYFVSFELSQPHTGWTENYFREEVDIDTAIGFSNAQLQKMMKFRSSLTILSEIRVRDITQPRAAKIRRVSFRGGRIDTLTPDPVDMSAVYTLRGTAPFLARRNVWFRGVVDDDVLRDPVTGNDTPSAALDTDVTAWIGQMPGMNFRIRALYPIDGMTYVYIDVDSITVNAGGTVTLNFATPIVPANYPRIILSLFDRRLWPGLNGKWRVRAATANTLTIPFKAVQAVGGPYAVSKGRLRIEAYRVCAMTPSQCDFLRFRSHKTGRDPLGGRGRRSVARIGSR